MFKSLKQLFNLSKILERTEPNEVDTEKTSQHHEGRYAHESNHEVIDEIQQRISRIETTLVQDIIIPRTDVLMLSLHSSKEEIIEFMKKHSYSRIPIYNQSIDDIVGVLYLKDLIPYLLNQHHESQLNIKNFLRPVLFIPESKRLLDMLKEFREKNVHLGIVVDEYGGFSGIATLGNVLEEIVGDMPEEEEEELIQKIGDNTYHVQAGTDIEDLNQELDINIPIEENDTIGGFVFDLFGHIPKESETIEYKNIRFHVLKIQRNRITEIKLETQIKINPEKKENNLLSSNSWQALWML